MKTTEEYLSHAHDCEELARKVQDQEQRRIIAEMARTWRLLAGKRAKQLETEGSSDR